MYKVRLQAQVVEIFIYIDLLDEKKYYVKQKWYVKHVKKKIWKHIKSKKKRENKHEYNGNRSKKKREKKDDLENKKIKNVKKINKNQ